MNRTITNIIYNTKTAALINKYYSLKTSDTKDFIFVATTGRSGTLTLVDIFNQLDNCIALHEPYPAMHADILHAAAYGDDKKVEEFYKIRKSINIRRRAAGYKHYVEANHLFIKTFISYAVKDFGSRIKVIHLVRDPVKVANSIYALQDQPGTKEGNNWWLDYKAPTNLISIATILDEHEEFKHPYYKALWYWYETEARIAQWKKDLPEVPFINFRTEDFNDEEKLSTLFQQLDIPVPPSFVHNVNNTKSHARTHQKKVLPLPEEDSKKMHTNFQKLLISQGFNSKTT